METERSLPCSQEPNFPMPCVLFCNKSVFHSEGLLAPRLRTKLKDHSFPAVRYCLLNVFTSTIHMQMPFPPPVTRGRAMSWCQGPT